jgi:hypothetical protein
MGRRLGGERVDLCGWRKAFSRFLSRPLAFLEPLPERTPGEGRRSGVARREAPQGPGEALPAAMLLFPTLRPIVALADEDGRAILLVIAADGRGVVNLLISRRV